MSCYHPLKAFQVGFNEITKKPKYKICSYDVQYVWRYLGGEDWHNSLHTSFGYEPGIEKVSEYIEIPCGKCIGCRLKYSRDWADRCVFESRYHDTNYFVTLTYSDDNLPLSHSKDILGLEYDTPTLNPRDVTLFLKRLRKAGKEFRYFLCGEYGSSTLRPHYHICFFGLELDDLVEYKKSINGNIYYNSPFLEKMWNLGFVVITQFSWETAAYTARYCMKKVNNNLKDFYEMYNLQPEFVRMSRRPGLAAQYYRDNPENIYDDDTLYVKTLKGVQKRKPP